ncbi:MAG: 30S ribosomal protein S12 methylthiotransferase RimO [Acidobacteria bacterium]|nr:MAG: 30S ribosomal protein S12 methylthiotransferase RimO [Acidobacteriota bacterium]
MNPKKVGMLSLGCAKNLVDSEVMLGSLKKDGYQLTAKAEDADIVIVNTCGFIDSAKEESIDAILEMGELKKSGQVEKLIVTGCLSQRYHEAMERDIPEVDLFLGTGHTGDIATYLSKRTPVQHWEPDFLYSATSERVLSTPGHSAYVKISEGCNHSCSFCIIPKLRGPHRSRTREDIVQEVTRLGRQGVREINLVAQDSTYYGKDLGIRNGLAELLEELCQINSIDWIRVHYLYPHEVSDHLLEMFAHPKVCSYLDIPLQHASQSVLKSMKRGGNRSSYSRFLDQIRKARPNVFIRSSFIVGYPGETEADFAELVSFVREQEFNYLGVFTYSHEEGTGAYDLSDTISDELKQERLHQIMSLQRDISKKKCAQLKGQTLDVLVEGVHPETELLLQGRHQGQAPDVDGEVFITEGIYKPGDMVPVTIEETYEYDMAGRVIGGIDV